jgi:hypothetical protein
MQFQSVLRPIEDIAKPFTNHQPLISRSDADKACIDSYWERERFVVEALRVGSYAASKCAARLSSGWSMPKTMVRGPRFG